MISKGISYVNISAISALGTAKATEYAPQLHHLFESPQKHVKISTILALGQLASSETIDILREIALEPVEYVSVRLAAIDALSSFFTEKNLMALLEILDSANEHYSYRTILALRNFNSKQTLPKFFEFLHKQERNRSRWRKIRDEDVDSYNDNQMEDWRTRLQVVQPQAYMEFELAHSIAMIDPDEGIKLYSQLLI